MTNMILPQELEFIKASCAGGDYLLLHNLKEDELCEFDLQELAFRMCSRIKGVGAKGVIILNKDLIYEYGYVNIRIVSPRFSPDFLCYDALLCSARYLFDTGAFGSKPIRLQWGNDFFVVEPVDSQNFRLELCQASNDGLKVDLLSSLSRIENNETQCLPLELHQKIAAVYRPGLDGKELFKTVCQQKSTLLGYPYVYYSVPQRDLVLAASRRSATVDYSSVAALAALAAYLEGFCSSDILLILNNFPFYVQMSFPGPRLWITAPIRFSFSGTFSCEPLASLSL